MDDWPATPPSTPFDDSGFVSSLTEEESLALSIAQNDAAIAAIDDDEWKRMPWPANVILPRDEIYNEHDGFGAALGQCDCIVAPADRVKLVALHGFALNFALDSTLNAVHDTGVPHFNVAVRSHYVFAFVDRLDVLTWFATDFGRDWRLEFALNEMGAIVRFDVKTDATYYDALAAIWKEYDGRVVLQQPGAFLGHDIIRSASFVLVVREHDIETVAIIDDQLRTIGNVDFRFRRRY